MEMSSLHGQLAGRVPWTFLLIGCELRSMYWPVKNIYNCTTSVSICMEILFYDKLQVPIIYR